MTTNNVEYTSTHAIWEAAIYIQTSVQHEEFDYNEAVFR